MLSTVFHKTSPATRSSLVPPSSPSLPPIGPSTPLFTTILAYTLDCVTANSTTRSTVVMSAPDRKLLRRLKSLFASKASFYLSSTDVEFIHRNATAKQRQVRRIILDKYADNELGRLLLDSRKASEIAFC